MKTSFAVRQRLSSSAAGREILRLLNRSMDEPGVVALDPYANFSYSTVQASSSIIGSAATPKTIVVSTGDGNHFPGGDGTSQFNVVCWPANTRPLVGNAEIIRCTRVGDILTTTARGQEGSATRANIASGDQVMAAVTLKAVTDLAFGSADIDVASGATVTLSQPFTGISGTATITNIALGAGLTARKGYKVSLWLESGLTIQNNGGGTGNIRTALAGDTTYPPNAIVDFVYDGTVWREASAPALLPTGSFVPFAALTVPSGFLACDGSAVSRSTYAALFTALVQSKGTVTVTIASPGVFTLTAHGLVAGDVVYLETTGALPTGLAADTPYYVIAGGLAANTFELSATRGGSAIVTTGTQSGVHTLFFAPYAIAGMGASTFTVPDLRGRVIAGFSSAGKVEVATLSNNDGLAASLRTPSHHHTFNQFNQNAGGSTAGGSSNAPAAFYSAGSLTTGDSDNLDKPSYLVANYLIKT